MMNKDFHVMKDPKMDRIFKRAYYATLKAVERRERDKSVQDHINAYVELFEQELDRRDLTAEEQRAFLEAFETTMKQDDLHRQKMRKTRKRFFAIGGGSIAVVVLVVFILHVGINRPFMPLPKVEADLQYYLEKVDAGFGEFSENFYTILRRYDGRLGAAKTAQYQKGMYAELEEHFQELLTKLQNGEIAYIDDARLWANYFPERAEQKARKKMVTNAVVGGVGENIGSAVESILEGAKDIIDRTIDAIDNK
jgi:hypothetical protein